MSHRCGMHDHPIIDGICDECMAEAQTEYGIVSNMSYADLDPTMNDSDEDY